jgi:predicted transcriptional regulator
MPLMVSAVLASLLAEELYGGSIYDRLLERSGIRLPNQLGLTRLIAGDIVNREAASLTEALSLSELHKLFENSQQVGFPVTNEGRLEGLVTKSDLGKISEKGNLNDTVVGDVITSDPIAVHLKADLASILYLFGKKKIGLLPVLTERNWLVSS